MLILIALYIIHSNCLDCFYIFNNCQNCEYDDTQKAYVCLDKNCRVNEECSINICSCKNGYIGIENGNNFLCKSIGELTGVSNCIEYETISNNNYQCKACYNSRVLINGVCKLAEEITKEEAPDQCESLSTRYYYSERIQCYCKDCQEDTTCDSRNNWVLLEYDDKENYKTCQTCSSLVYEAINGNCESSSCLSKDEIICTCASGSTCTAKKGWFKDSNQHFVRCDSVLSDCYECALNTETNEPQCIQCHSDFLLDKNGTCLSCSSVLGRDCLTCRYYDDGEIEQYQCTYLRDKYDHVECLKGFGRFKNDNICVNVSYYFRNHNNFFDYYYDTNKERITCDLLGCSCAGKFGFESDDINCNCRYPKKIYYGRCYTPAFCPNNSSFINCKACGYVESIESGITCIEHCKDGEYYDPVNKSCEPCRSRFGDRCIMCNINECTNGFSSSISINGNNISCNEIFGDECSYCSRDGHDVTCQSCTSTINKCKSDEFVYKGTNNHCYSCTSIENCSACSSLEQCTRCSDGFFFSEGICISCGEKYGVHCLTCNESECETFGDNAVLVGDKYVLCKDIFGDNCRKCKYESDIATCTECVLSPECKLYSCENGWAKNKVNECFNCDTLAHGCKKCYPNAFCVKCYDEYFPITNGFTEEILNCTLCSTIFSDNCLSCSTNIEVTEGTCKCPDGSCTCKPGWGMRYKTNNTVACETCKILGEGCEECTFENKRLTCNSGCEKGNCKCPDYYTQISDTLTPMICQYGDGTPFVCRVDNCTECEDDREYECKTCNEGYKLTKYKYCIVMERPDIPENLKEYKDKTMTVSDPTGNEPMKEIYEILLPDDLEKIVLNNEKYGLYIDFTDIKTETPIQINSVQSTHPTVFKFNYNNKPKLQFDCSKLTNVEIIGAEYLEITTNENVKQLELGTLDTKKTNHNPFTISTDVPTTFDKVLIPTSVTLESSTPNLVSVKEIVMNGANLYIKNIQINDKIELQSRTFIEFMEGVSFSENAEIDISYNDYFVPFDSVIFGGKFPSTPPRAINFKSLDQTGSNIIEYGIAYTDDGSFDCAKWKKSCKFENSNKLNACKCDRRVLSEGDEDENGNYLFAIEERESGGSSHTSSNGTSQTIIIAVVVVIVVIVVVVIIVVVCIVVKKKRKNRSSNEVSSQEGDVENK